MLQEKNHFKRVSTIDRKHVSCIKHNKVPIHFSKELTIDHVNTLLANAQIGEITAKIEQNRLNEDDIIPSFVSFSPNPHSIAKDNQLQLRFEIISHASMNLKLYDPPKTFEMEPGKLLTAIYLPTGLTHNFMGALVGPRGSTQKELEANSHTVLAYRGAGSSRGESNNPEPLHVIIKGDTQGSLEKAKQLIYDIIRYTLRPDIDNPLKAKQLQKLAVMNGATETMQGAPITVVKEKVNDFIEWDDDTIFSYIDKDHLDILLLTAPWRKH